MDVELAVVSAVCLVAKLAGSMAVRLVVTTVALLAAWRVGASDDM